MKKNPLKEINLNTKVKLRVLYINPKQVHSVMAMTTNIEIN
jgi:hypothetical protein